MNFINYINSLHNLNALGVNALAESQINSDYFQDIYTPFPIIENLKELIKGHNNNIIVLTGHAGDGKSTIAFNLLQELDISYKTKTFKEYEYLKSYDLHMLKDMSELNIDTRREHLTKAFGSKGNWIIVSNTGPLLTSIVDALSRTNLANQDSLSQVLGLLSQDLDISEESSNLGNLKINVDGKNLYIINVAKLDNIEIALEIFKKIITHEEWKSPVQSHPNHAIIKN